MAIFMIGTQRSGSNLLRLMVNQLPSVAAPHPPHILVRMMPLVEAGAYGGLRDAESLLNLTEDVCRLVELNPIPWKDVKLDRHAVIANCRAPTLLGIMEAVYDELARAWGADDWCCKSMANIHYLPEIETHFDEPRYIYLYRDGRDVALSFKNAIVGEKHVYHIAREWARTQRLALALEPNVPGDRFFKVGYEQILEYPEKTMKKLCRFLGREYDSGMLDFFESGEAKSAASTSNLWGNVSRPIMKSNYGKFLTQSSPEESRIFESVAGDVLDKLGYRRYYIEPGEEIRFTSAHLAEFDEENARMKKEVLMGVDSSDRERRDRQQGFIESIFSRVENSKFTEKYNRH